MMRLMAPKAEAGQTLITLVVFVAVMTTLTSALVIVAVTSMRTNSKFASSETALAAAEAGAEQAVLRVIRDPVYTGETMAAGNGTATISVSGTTTKTIISEGTVGSLHRRVQVVVTVGTNNVVTVTSWSHVD